MVATRSDYEPTSNELGSSGQPFRDVEWASGRQPEIVCTPSIKGAAAPSLQPWGRRRRYNYDKMATTAGFGVVPVVATVTGLLLAMCWESVVL